MRNPLDRKIAAWVSAALVLAALVVYLRIGGHDFVDYDDPLYVTENPHVLAGLTADGLRWAFVTTETSNWHPVTWLSHMLDCQLFGPNPGAHHLVSLLLHVINALLLFALLRRMTGAVWPSAFAAFLFAVHPLNVESVAWVAERKNVLSTLFWLLATGAYLRYVARPTAWRYASALTLYAVGLMAKPMLVTLPLALLLLDCWPLSRLRTRGAAPFRTFASLIREKLPFLLLAAASSAVTYLVQHRTGAVAPLDALPLGTRVGNALVSYVVYALKTIWPTRLAVIYPYEPSLPGWQLAVAALTLAGVTLAALLAARRTPAFLVGWLWYAGTLVPVIGLVQVGRQARADRYAYVPLIGLFLIVAWGVPALLSSAPVRKTVTVALAAVAILALTLVAWRQAGYWKDSGSLFERALSVTRNNAEAHNAYGVYLARHDAPLDAVSHYEEALRVQPRFADAHYNLANALSRLGRSGEAIAQYDAVLNLRPDDPDAHNNLAILLHRLGRLDEASVHYRAALALRPDYAQAHNNLAQLLARQGKFEEARYHFSEALRIKPDYANAREGLDRLAGREAPSPATDAPDAGRPRSPR